MPTTNGSLLLDLQQGHAQQRWDEFVDIYRPLITHALRRTGIPAQELEDVHQSVLLQLVKVLPLFCYQREKGFFRSWLRRVAMNQAVDYRRRTGRTENVLISSDAVAEACSEADLNGQFDRELLAAALKGVQGEFRQRTWECFSQRVLLQKPAEQVSRDLGLSENAVYINTSRVLSRLREFCELHGEELQYDHHFRRLRSI